MADEKYVQLSSWEEFIAWLEKAGAKVLPDEVRSWNPKPVRKSRKKPPQEEGLF